MEPPTFKLNIPGRKALLIKYLLLDFNGTLAVDGILIPGVMERLKQLSSTFEIHIVTADTFGSVTDQLNDLPVQIIIIPKMDQAKQKFRHLEKLGETQTIAMGNGRNDILILEKAALGIGLIQTEGSYSNIIRTADLIYTDINDALDSLIKPNRIIAALRN